MLFSLQGVEIFSSDGSQMYLVLNSQKERDNFYDELIAQQGETNVNFFDGLEVYFLLVLIRKLKKTRASAVVYSPFTSVFEIISHPFPCKILFFCCAQV